MPPKHKNRQRNKSASTAPVTSDNSSIEPVTSNISASNYSEAVAEIFVESYNFASMYVSTSLLSKKQLKELNRLIMKADELYYHVNRSKNARDNDAISLAQTYYYLSCLFTGDSEQDFSMARACNARSMELLQAYALEPKAFMTILRVYLNAGYIFLNHNHFESAISTLKLGLCKYNTYMLANKLTDVPTDMKCILKEEEELDIPQRIIIICIRIVKNLITAYLLEKPREPVNSEVFGFQHMLLELYLKTSMDDDTKHYFITFSYNLARELVTSDRFTEARDHIVAGGIISAKLVERKNKTFHCTNCQNLGLVINSMWGYYGSNLLLSSKLYRNAKNTEYIAMKSIPSTSEESTPQRLVFTDLKDDIKKYPVLITDKFISDYDSAKEVLVQVMRYLNKAIIYTTFLRNYMYGNIMLFKAEVFHHFTYFESVPSTRNYIHKNEDDCLMDICDKGAADQHRMIKFVYLKRAILVSKAYEDSIEYLNDGIMFFDDMKVFDYKEMENFMNDAANDSLDYFKFYLH